MGLPQVLCVDVMGCYLGVLGGLLIVGACVFLTFMPALETLFLTLGCLFLLHRRPLSCLLVSFIVMLCFYLLETLLFSEEEMEENWI